MNNKTELAKKIYDEKNIKKMAKKLKLLGLKNKMDAVTFLNLRLFTTMIVFVLNLYIFEYGYIIAPIITVLYYYLFEKIFLSDKIEQRTSKLEGEAMHFFETLTLSLETGRNLEAALDVTTSNIDSELSDEFKEAIRGAKYGKSLTESLNDMQSNIPSETINNIILTLTQADLFGNSIIDTMYNQVDYLREKKKMEVRGAISKVPIKISILSVIFFIPLILLIVIAPVILSFFNL